jgi:hypothetical protein
MLQKNAGFSLTVLNDQLFQQQLTTIVEIISVTQILLVKFFKNKKMVCNLMGN